MTLYEVITSGNIDNPFLLTWLVFKEGGWIVFLVVFIRGMYLLWMNYIWGDYAAKREWVTLAIDVPRSNEQSPKAVENFFAQIAGGHGSINKYEKYWVGKTQDWFSFEIVSIGGNVQYIIRTIARFRDLVEASIYAQYTDAEITEVEDYTENVPQTFPNETHKLWGAEFIMQESSCLPIRTYPEFEHQIAQELKDPLSAFLETMSAISPDEQVWYQIVVTPIGYEWRNECKAMIDKLLGKGPAAKKGLGAYTTGFISEASNQLIRGQVGAETLNSAGDAAPAGAPLSFLSPEYKTIEAIQRKIGKIGFNTKIRLIYIATNEAYTPSRVIQPLVGAIKQFSELNLNSIYPDMKRTATRAAYLFVKQRIAYRSRRIFSGYKNRSNYIGRSPFVLNIEELATLYHFPVTMFKTAPVQQTASKKFDAPLQTPYETAAPTSPAKRRTLEELRNSAMEEESMPTVSPQQQTNDPLAPPDNLPM